MHSSRMNPHAQQSSGKVFFIFIFVSFFMFFSALPAFANEMCKRGKKELVGSYDVIQAKGGVWGLMEQTSGLQDKSVLGLQVDGKIRRAISIFEEMCQNGKTPTPELFKEIQDLIGDGRMLFNLSPDRTPPKTILESVTTVNEKATALLAKLGE